MRIIISPAKKMNVQTDILTADYMPRYIDRTEKLLQWMQGLSLQELKTLWGCNDKIALQNYERIRHMDLRRGLTPSLLAYEGIQYQYMAPQIFSQDELDYVQDHLQILSGFYGVLKPMDSVVPYRLEMQARIHMNGCSSLYDFWGDALYRAVMDGNDDRLIINLASKEYSRTILPWLTPQDRMITCIFGELKDGKILQKGTMAKMARGEMVRFMASQWVCEADELKEFDGLGYAFDQERSDEHSFVFLK
ncbi:MAG: peroxide stress protein YaaA [Eubacteriales bacterium]|nr:peroxide stress protein YaaA [Eubacteriales bacterium]